MGISSGIAGAVGALPAGAVIPYAGSAAPANWLLCGGQAVSRTDYAALFAVVGTTYGAGDGSTTFNLPDLRGRIPAGKDDMGGTAASRLTSTTITSGATTLGNNGGAQTHTLTEAQLASHTHIQNAHSHEVGADGLGRMYQQAGGGSGSGWGFTTGGDAVLTTWLRTMSAFQTTPTNQSTGSNQAHNNVQPTIILNYIIKATAL